MKFRLSDECKELIDDKWGKYTAVAELICKDILRQQGMNALRLGCSIGVLVGSIDGGPDELIEAVERMEF